jgi:hypothetical protein
MKLPFQRTSLGCLAVIVGMFVCMSVTFLGVDAACRINLTQRLPIYPGAEIRARAHNFLSEFGIGDTTLTLYTPDELEQVREWYNTTVARYVRAAAQSGDPFIRLSQGSTDIQPDESGVGTQILLFGTCVS